MQYDADARYFENPTRLVDIVGLVVADHESLFSFQQRHEEMGKTRARRRADGALRATHLNIRKDPTAMSLQFSCISSAQTRGMGPLSVTCDRSLRFTCLPRGPRLSLRCRQEVS
jgi:hypothetical protein